jgi:hypothetical protein
MGDRLTKDYRMPFSQTEEREEQEKPLTNTYRVWQKKIRFLFKWQKKNDKGSMDLNKIHYPQT